MAGIQNVVDPITDLHWEAGNPTGLNRLIIFTSPCRTSCHRNGILWFSGEPLLLYWFAVYFLSDFEIGIAV